MSWNYRVIQTVQDGEISLAIHEVYYGPGEEYIEGWAISPAPVQWFAGEDPRKTLAMMAEALNKPVLTDEGLPA